MRRNLLLVAALPSLAAEELFSTAQCDTWAYMAGCPEGRVAVQNECWLLSSPDAPSCGEACGGDAFVDVAGTQARGSQTEVVGCLEHGFLDGRHIRAQHLHLIPQQMNELNRPCAGVYSYEPLIDTWHCYTWYARRNSAQFCAILRNSAGLAQILRTVGVSDRGAHRAATGTRRYTKRSTSPRAQFTCRPTSECRVSAPGRHRRRRRRRRRIGRWRRG